MYRPSANNDSREQDCEELKALFGDNTDWVKQGLRELRDVPPMQLSNDRLRDAILGQGLSPESTPSSPSIPWWRWAWAPVAAGALAIALVPLIRPAAPTRLNLDTNSFAMVADPAPSGSLLGESGVAKMRAIESSASANKGTVAGTSAEVTTPAPSTANTASTVPTVAPRVRSERTSSYVTSNRRTRSSRPTVTSAPKRADAKAEVNELDAALQSGAAAALFDGVSAEAPQFERGTAFARKVDTPAGPLAMASVMSQSQDDSIVLLSSEEDPATGAAAASEIDSHVNVSIGG